MGEQIPGPICTTNLGQDWIDKGTNCLTHSTAPGPTGLNTENSDLLSGAAWRAVYLLEYGGTYRLMYASEAAEITRLKGRLPKADLEQLRGQLKSKYQQITPPEVEKLLRAYVGKNMTYVIRQAALTLGKQMRQSTKQPASPSMQGEFLSWSCSLQNFTKSIRPKIGNGN